MFENIMIDDDDVTSKRYKRVSELLISELIQIVWILIVQNIYSFIEEFFYRFQWCRKRIGGKWSLLCHSKEVYWSQDDSLLGFTDAMAGLGVIVDVIKTEDWTNG